MKTPKDVQQYNETEVTVRTTVRRLRKIICLLGGSELHYTRLARRIQAEGKLGQAHEFQERLLMVRSLIDELSAFMPPFSTAASDDVREEADEASALWDEEGTRRLAEREVKA
jgi:hypothetical protein